MNEENGRESEGLKNHTIVFMIVVALFFDALQWLFTFVFLGWLVSIFALLTFYVWFKMKGISFMRPKRALAMGGGFIIELIPILQVIPAWTFVVAYIAFEAKAKKVIGGVPGGQMATRAMSAGKQNSSTP